MDQSVTESPSLIASKPSDLRRGNPLALEEILRLILQFADKTSLVTVARVCQLWSCIALNELWKSLPSIFPLLNLLAPREWIMDVTKYHTNLLSSLADTDWERFRRYALRVRCVNNDFPVEADLPFDSAALVQMLYGPWPLLPNVETIAWTLIDNRNCTSILPFIGPQLQKLYLTMDQSINDLGPSQLMQSLRHRTKNLALLWIASSVLSRRMGRSLASFLSCLPQLVHLKLPAFYLTKEVVTAVAKLQLLKILSYSDWTRTEETYNESGMCFEFTPGSFPHLVNLAFASLPTRMAKVLEATDHVGRLRVVNLDCPAYYSEQEIRTVFASLAAGAKCLTTIQLVCCPLSQLKASSSNEPLSIDTIRPLFSCTRLARLHLSAPHFTPLKDEDVIEMGGSWPAMYALALCPSPLVKRNVGVRFDILCTFARSFPNLRKLQLFFGKEVSEFDGDLYPAYQFGKLESLGLGLSLVPRGHAQDIGFLLASLCRHPPEITSGVTVYHRGDDITDQELEELEVACSEVRSLMDLAFRTKSSFTRKFATAGSAAVSAQGTL